MFELVSGWWYGQEEGGRSLSRRCSTLHMQLPKLLRTRKGVLIRHNFSTHSAGWAAIEWSQRSHGSMAIALALLAAMSS